MFNQQTEDAKKRSQAATLAPLQFCSLFGAGGGDGAADYISQPEPSVRTWPRPSGGIYAALRWQPPYATQRCAAARRSGDRTHAITGGPQEWREEADLLKGSLAWQDAGGGVA